MENEVVKLAILGMTTEFTPEQKEQFEKYQAEMKIYLDKVQNPEISDEEKVALVAALSLFGIELQSIL